MKTVISASRRTDLVAFFPEWLSEAMKNEKAQIYGPSGHCYAVDLNPEAVHTFVLWSKNFTNLILDHVQLYSLIRKYDQLYIHFTITGLGGSFIEKGVPKPSEAVAQLDPLIKIAGRPERISVRFDPIVYWKDEGKIKTNFPFFEKLAPELRSRGIKTVRFSFAQWYDKARRRAMKNEFFYVNPTLEEKISSAHALLEIARANGLRLFACAQEFLSEVSGIFPSSCIDGALLQDLHPLKETVLVKKDESQRPECLCTESVDIGSYSQSCPHSCLYCYANPRI